MNNNGLVALSFLILTLCALSSYGANSSVFTPSTKQSMIICPKVDVGGTTLTSTNQTVSLGTSDCISGVTGGGLAWVASVVGGVFEPNCASSNNTHPYLGGITEGWGGVFIVLGFPGSGGAGMTVTCCSTPQPQMTLNMGYNAGIGDSTWQPGPACP